MDNTVGREQESGTRQSGNRRAALQIIGRLLSWLAGFFRMTEEEQKDAGIYLGGQRFE